MFIVLDLQIRANSVGAQCSETFRPYGAWAPWMGDGYKHFAPDGAFLCGGQVSRGILSLEEEDLGEGELELQLQSHG